MAGKLSLINIQSTEGLINEHMMVEEWKVSFTQPPQTDHNTSHLSMGIQMYSILN